MKYLQLNKSDWFRFVGVLERSIARGDREAVKLANDLAEKLMVVYGLRSPAKSRARKRKR